MCLHPRAYCGDLIDHFSDVLLLINSVPLVVVRFDQVFFEQLGKADALEKKLMEFNSTLGGSAAPEQRLLCSFLLLLIVFIFLFLPFLWFVCL